MPAGLDEFYRYIEDKEKRAAESAVERAPVPNPGTDENFRYVVRGGITIPVPVGEPDPPLIIEGDDDPDTDEGDDAVEQPPVEVKSSVRPTGRPALRIPNPKQVVEQPLIPPLPPAHPASDAIGAELWEGLPRHVQILASMAPEPEPPTRTFEETRNQLIARLLDPTLTLEETAKLLDVCPATVRRYANRGNLVHHRTLGQQRRFKLSDVMAFLDRRAARQRGDA